MLSPWQGIVIACFAGLMAALALGYFANRRLSLTFLLISFITTECLLLSQQYFDQWLWTHGQERTGVSLWRDTVAKSPRLPSANLNLAVEYDHLHKDTDAVRQYQTAMRLAADRLNANPQDHLSRVVLVIAQSDLGVLLMNAGDMETAEAAFRGALRVLPGQSAAVANLAGLLMRQGKYTEAITVIDDVIRWQNLNDTFSFSSGKLFQNKAIALCELGLAEESNNNFKRASAMEADFAIPGTREPRLHCGEQEQQ